MICALNGRTERAIEEAWKRTEYREDRRRERRWVLNLERRKLPDELFLHDSLRQEVVHRSGMVR